MSKPDTVYQFSIGAAATLSVAFPAFALLFCIIYSILFNFDEVIVSPESPCPNRTVDYLPSITACFSQFYPQTWVWWIGFAFPLWPRLVIAKFFYTVHTSAAFKKASSFSSKTVNRLALSVYYGGTVDVIALVFVSYIVDLRPPDANVPENDARTRGLINLAHSMSFGAFLVSSQVYVLFQTMLHCSVDFYDNLKTKKVLTAGYLCCVMGAVVFFMYKQTRPCQDMLQTYFSIFEYLVVTINLYYHLISALDFSHYSFSISPPVPEYHTKSQYLTNYDTPKLLQSHS